MRVKPKTESELRAEAATAKLRKYWQSMDHRLPYLKAAQAMVADMEPETALEIGAAGLAIFHGSDTMDIDADLAPDYLHDATSIPWPIPDKAYDVAIALQVLEHLGGSQRAAFEEMARVARAAVISLPYNWKTGTPCHLGIGIRRIREWTGQRRPVATTISKTGKCRIALRYEFD